MRSRFGRSGWTGGLRHQDEHFGTDDELRIEDADQSWPSRLFAAVFAAARHPGLTRALVAPMRWTAVHHSPAAFGLLMSRPRPAALTARWVEPARSSAVVRQDVARFARATIGNELVEAASWLERFTGPVRPGVGRARPRLHARPEASGSRPRSRPPQTSA